MISEDIGLTEVPRTERLYYGQEEWNFGEGDVRKAFQKVFTPGQDYVLFQTIANKEAVDVLRRYIASRKDMSSPWNIRKIQRGDTPEYCPGATDKGNGLQFDNSLMDSYQRAIDKIANENLGERNFSHYPMVSTNGVHNLDRDSKSIFWPIIYMVTAEKEESLKEIIDNLSGDKSFEMLKEQESPQFYQMAEIETLHKLGIAPLVRLPQELRVGAKDLSRYVDFFAQMEESYKWTGSVREAD